MKVIFKEFEKKDMGIYQKHYQNVFDIEKTRSISFQKRKTKANIQASWDAFKKTPDIPCPCCGNLMLPADTYKNIKWPHGSEIPLIDKKTNKIYDFQKKPITKKRQKINFMKKTMQNNTELIIDVLQTYEDYMHGVEKKVFSEIKKMSKRYPEESLQGLLVKLRPKHLKKLAKKQLLVFDEMNNAIKKLPNDKQEILFKLVNKAEQDVLQNKYFKRMDFIDEIMKSSSSLQDKKSKENINNLAFSLPKSSENESAFIVKYSGAKTNTKHGEIIKEYRSAREIAQSLLIGSVGSDEHIRPLSAGGKSSPLNYLVECCNCNNHRSHLRLDKWVIIHKEMVKNAQKYIDFVIDRINNKKINSFEWYPKAIFIRLLRESKGKIMVNISKLK